MSVTHKRDSPMKSPYRKPIPEYAAEARAAFVAGNTLSALSKIYGVSRSTLRRNISRVANGPPLVEVVRSPHCYTPIWWHEKDLRQFHPERELLFTPAAFDPL